MKLNKSFLLATSTLMLCALLLTGCARQAAQTQRPPEPQPDQQTTEVPQTDGNETTVEPAPVDSIYTVAAMLGQSDEAVKDFFDGGAENRTEDNTTLLGRSYTATLDGSEVTMESIYTEDETVAAISVSFTEKTVDEVKAILTDAFGEPETTDDTAEMETKQLTWTHDQVSITMNESYGLPIVEFTANSAA